MNKEIAKIERTFLGREDHGIFTAMLHVSYGGSGQGIGGYSLDERPEGEGGGGRRRGTAFGMEFVMGVCRACGVDSWEQVRGRTIMVLKDGDRWNGKVVGIEPLPTEKGEPFMFDELAAETQEAVPV